MRKICWSVQDYIEMSFKLFTTKKRAVEYIKQTYKSYNPVFRQNGFVLEKGNKSTDNVLCFLRVEILL